jgi:hypothetical protein
MSRTPSPEIVQTVFFAQLIVATGDKAQLVGGYAEGGKDSVQELGVVRNSECNGFKGSFAGIEECVNLAEVDGKVRRRHRNDCLFCNDLRLMKERFGRVSTCQSESPYTLP